MEDVRTMVEALGRWANRLMPDLDRARELHRDLQCLLEAELDPAAPLSRDILDIFESTCHRTARHLTLEQHLEPGRPDDHAPGWPSSPRAEIDARAGSVRSVQRQDLTGELRLDGFDDLVHASSYLQAAFTILRGCNADIIDLRSNGGGALSSLALVAEFVLGPEPTHLATVRYRDRPPRQWWTAGGLGTMTLHPAAQVAVLIGPGTYSSGEAVAYHLQHRGRVRTFGSPTPGAADHVTPIRVTPTVTALHGADLHHPSDPQHVPADLTTGLECDQTGGEADLHRSE